jgi:hypothetical protein
VARRITHDDLLDLLKTTTRDLSPFPPFMPLFMEKIPIPRKRTTWRRTLTHAQQDVICSWTEFSNPDELAPVPTPRERSTEAAHRAIADWWKEHA